jgi:hypothetical protein
MNPKLLSALKAIEQAGHKFNEATAKGEDLTEIFENSAYRAIIEFLFNSHLRFGSYDWDKLESDYEDEGILEVMDALQDMQMRVLGELKTTDGDMPTEVFALFYTMSACFHYPGYECSKKRVYVDMDNVIVDFPSAFKHYTPEFLDSHPDKDEIKGIFGQMAPMPGAIAAMEWLYRHFDLYILSTAPWGNSSAWCDKVEWIKKYLPVVGYKRLILSHHKNLNDGDYLIDDRTKNGVLKFKGEHIHFGTPAFPDWLSVTDYLTIKA